VAARDNPVKETLGVYVSVPFCKAKCSFCNFASGVSSADVVEMYVTDLCREIDGAAARAQALGAEMPRSVDTVYFGGGTPSLLSPAQLEQVFAALCWNFDVSANAEITLEAAPGQIEDSLLEAAMRLGVNRVSLGVQSFVDQESAAVGRSHTGESCRQEFARLRAAGIADVGADLIAGLPYQTMESWEESLAKVRDAGLTHVSVYMLEVDEDSRLGREVMSGGLRLHAPRVPDDELVAAMYERACEDLPRMGFAQYEISNFAAKGFEAKHNRKYWERAPYVGFGLDAHSMLVKQGAGSEAVRFANPDALEAYGIAESTVTQVGEREAFEERVFLGLRLVEGLNVQELREEFQRVWVESLEEAARELINDGLMEVDGTRWKLTLRGRMLSNNVFGHLLEGVAV
jgi:oxygen-independent coproporphyrinogen-3 oxidase